MEHPINVVSREAYYSGKKSYNVALPEISQLEVTNACNFTCDFCPRVNGRPDVFIDPLLVAKMIERGDFGGSHFVEFQLSGEPTLHRGLEIIIEAMRQVPGLMLGMSTNGSSIHSERVLRALLSLDYLTVSVDSVSNYETVRPGGKLKRLVENIDKLVDGKVRYGSKTVIDLQLIEFPGWERERESLMGLAAASGWEDHVIVRTVPDCFESVTRDRRKFKMPKELCVNPWTSVSIHADGDVVPCCFAFGKEVVYGNLNDQSLAEIWNESPVVQRFRDVHALQYVNGGGYGTALCNNCTQRSPTLMHLDLYKDMVRRRIGG